MKGMIKVLVGASLVLALAACGDLSLKALIAQKEGGTGSTGGTGGTGGSTIRVGSVADSRGGTGWTLDGSFMTDTRAKLLNTANFGPSGTVKSTIAITDTAAAITTSLLNNFDVFFIGWIFNGTLTAPELTALTTWVSNGGVIIVSAADTSTDGVAAAFSYATNGASNFTVGPTGTYASDYIQPFGTGLTNPIFVGPFGNITSSTTVKLYGDVGVITAWTAPPVIAYDIPTGPHWYIVGDISFGSGKIVIITNIELITSTNGDMSSGGSISAGYGNEVFLGNLFAYAHR
jgi:hypothetical protein